MKNIIKVFSLGRLEYKKCLNIQKYLLKQHLQDEKEGSDCLLLVEHDPVYTVGIRRNAYPEASLDELRRRTDASIELTDRGGLITFHGPGQLVAYPILNLKQYKPSLKWYVAQLEQTVIDMCKVSFGLSAKRMCSVGYTGVWVNDSKVCAIGVHSKRYVTYHGLALNCNVNLDYFKYIVPCGIEDKQVGSLTSLLNSNVTVSNVEPLLCKSFESTFNAQLQLQNKEEVNNLMKRAMSN